MHIKLFLAGLFMLVMVDCEASESVQQQKHDILYADPTIVLDNGKYYMTGTGSQTPPGFTVLVSDDLQKWTTGTSDYYRFILHKGESYGETGFWAPQWLKEGDTYYFAYTANEQTALARGTSITGPFMQNELEPIDGSEKNIDPFLFKDDDGKYYLYHVRFNQGNYIWVAEFDMQTGAIKRETLKQCLDCTEAWERTDNYASDPIMEGPTVIKLDGKYYLFYSANHYMNIDYAVGYATADSPFGPWKKYEGNPIIHRSIVGENGSGHGDVFLGKDGGYYYVYHVHKSETKVSPRSTRIIPLHLTKSNDGLYDISVKGDEVIKPYQLY